MFLLYVSYYAAMLYIIHASIRPAISSTQTVEEMIFLSTEEIVSIPQRTGQAQLEQMLNGRSTPRASVSHYLFWCAVTRSKSFR
jgi:hypothetical protein